jgi:ComF family protein
MSAAERETGPDRSGEPFQWPPGVAETTNEVRTPATARAVEAAAPAGVWRAVERVWLAERSAPMAERLAAWTPDEPEAYCPRCATSVGAFEADVDGCAACRGRRLAWVGAVRLGAYEGVLREAVRAIKFERDRHAGAVVGKLLGKAVVARLLRAGVNPATATVVPVPVSFRRRMARGIDHALALGRGVAGAGSMDLERALVRSHRASQTSLPQSVRRRNVSGTMRARAGFDASGRVVVVVDDVRTTGATMTEACRAVRRAARSGEVEIWSCVVGVTGSQGRV